MCVLGRRLLNNCRWWRAGGGDTKRMKASEREKQRWQCGVVMDNDDGGDDVGVAMMAVGGINIVATMILCGSGDRNGGGGRVGAIVVVIRRTPRRGKKETGSMAHLALEIFF
jgi:hypothetical protein